MIEVRNARFGWRRRKPALIWGDDYPEADVGYTPEFPHCADNLDYWEMVWDVVKLVHSVREPGPYFLINCICGYAPDAGLDEPIRVTFPTLNQVAWEMDASTCSPALDQQARDAGGLRLIFERSDYEQDVRELLCAMQTTLGQTTPIGEWPDEQEREGFLNKYPPGTLVVNEGSEPDYGDDGIAEIMAIVSSDVAGPVAAQDFDAVN